MEGGLEVDGRPFRDGSRELGRPAAENAQRCVPAPGVVGVQPQPAVGRAVNVESGSNGAPARRPSGQGQTVRDITSLLQIGDDYVRPE